MEKLTAAVKRISSSYFHRTLELSPEELRAQNEGAYKSGSRVKRCLVKIAIGIYRHPVLTDLVVVLTIVTTGLIGLAVKQ